MKRSVVGILTQLTLFLALAALAPRVVQASDHADPMILENPDANITGLFFFPKGDQMILVLNVRRALTAPKPYNLEGIEFVVHMDLHSQVTFDSNEDRARYGGTIVKPDGLTSDVTIKFQLNNDTTVKGGKPSIEGLKDPDSIRIFTGVRDDPFIFPRFFKKNVISMVMSIPMSSFPAGQRDWILWGSTYKDGKQIDHVGRSNRTQLARFETLNNLPPTEHMPEIMRLLNSTNDLYTFLNGYKQSKPEAGFVQYVLQIRKYDLATDVMIYTNRFPPGFPNGRQLPDDIVALTCATGDCILQELSFVEGGWPRAVVNDKPFSDEFPFLAEPWPDKAEPPAPPSVYSAGFVTGGIRLLAHYIGWPLLILILIVIVAGIIGLIQFLWFLVRLLTGQSRRPAYG